MTSSWWRHMASLDHIELGVMPPEWDDVMCCITAINSLAPERCRNNFMSVFFKLILQIDILSNSDQIDLRRYWARSLTSYSITRLQWVNSLWPSDAILRPKSGSTLAQVMARCLTAPSHYLNQCWLNHQWSPVTFIIGQFQNRCLNHQSLKSVWKLHV